MSGDETGASLGRSAQTESPAPDRRRALVEAIVASASVTAVIAGLSAVGKFVIGDGRFDIGTAVGFVFLFATWLVGWRRDDATVRRYGLSLGGLVLPGRLDFAALAKAAAMAIAWALALAAIVFVPYYFGWRIFWQPKQPFALPPELLSHVLGQLIVVALPEEAFYRGYLQSRLDDAWTPRWRVFGATIGPGLLVASVIFAVGHVSTPPYAPARLAVFFPSLVFGWLRARTGGIGAGLTFHAMCNVFSELLGKGYGVHD